MPKLTKIIAPSLLVLESTKKIVRDTSFQAIYVFLLPDLIDGTITHRSFSFYSRRGQFSAAANQFIKQNMRERKIAKNSKAFRTKIFQSYLSALFLDMTSKNIW